MTAQPDRQRLLSQRLAGVGRRHRPSVATIPRTGGGDAPLSFEQERLWSADPAAPAYNSAMRVDLDGAVDPGALAVAVTAVVDRHAVLRSSFHDSPNGPIQRVHEGLRPDVTVCEMTDDDIEQAVAAEARRPFDLGSAPLIRVVLFRVAPLRSVLLITTHHLVSDGWFRVLFADLDIAYRDPGSLRQGTVQYTDYARWQRKRFAEGAWDESVRRLADSLAGAEPVNLHGDRSGPGGRASGEVTLRVPASLANGVRALASAAGGSVFMVLLAALHVVLARYTRRRDVTIGVPMDGRDREELSDVVGFFVNLLAVRVDARPDLTFRELLDLVRLRCLDAYEHRTTPLAKVLEAARECGGSWVPTAVLNFDAAPQTLVRLGSARGRASGVDTGEAKFDLNVFLTEDGADFAGSLIYRVGLFTASAAERLGRQWIHLLGEALADPAAPIGRLPLERAPARTPQPRPEHPTRCLHEWFTAVAMRQPEDDAVRCGPNRISYGELDAWSNRLARELRDRGVVPGAVVGLSADRSLELIAGQLAILKAGAAYLPLDPGYPPQRLKLMLRDSGVRLVLGQRQTADRISDAVEVVEITDCAAQPDSPLETNVDPSSAAYVIYTSGSTGHPKGVVVTHANVSRLLTATRHWFDFGPQDVWTGFHSYAFDFSVWEVWGALAFGGRLVVVPHDISRSPEDFLDLLEAEGVTVLNQTPSAFAQLSAAVVDRGRCAATLRVVVFGGEALDFDVLRDWYDHVPEEQVRLVNMYGITETTVHNTYRPVSRADTVAGLGSVIGEPIPDVTVHLLDETGAAVPDGVPGEIHVGGAGLALGYLGDPRRTAERFLPSQFDGQPGARLYRTGDLACRTGDGELRYLGRVDQQVKVRGFRIELGEVTSALRDHPAVLDAAAAVRDDGRGAQLVGYLVPRRAADVPNGEALREHLAALLPPQAIPVAFAWLDALPLTANGKLDLGALPVPDAPQNDDYVAPVNEVERILADIFAELLGARRVGTTDNFFHLGGDSIVAMQIAGRARASGVWIKPSDVLVGQTVGKLAALAAMPAATTRQPGNETGGTGLTPMQAWFLEQPLPQRSPWNQSRWLTAGEKLDLLRLERALAAVLDHHEALRSRVDGGRVEIGEVDGDIAVRVDLHAVPLSHHGRALRRAVSELHAGADIETGRAFRALVVDGLTKSSQILLVAHHFVVDAVSWDIIVEDLATAYESLAGCHDVTLPARSMSSPQWGGRLAGYTRTPRSQRELAFWTTALAATPGSLPVDVPQAPATEEFARTVWRSLDEQRTALLYNEVPNLSGASVEEALLTAAVSVLSDWSGLTRIRIDVERHGREQLFDDSDLLRTVGWLTAIFPVEVAGRGVDLADHLQQVTSRLRSIPNRGAGFGALRHLADADTRQALAGLAEPEVAFNYLGQRRGGGGGVFAVTEPPEALRAAPPRERAAGSPRTRLLAAEVVVDDGRLRLGWTHDARTRTDTAQRLADAYLTAVSGLIDEVLAGGGRLRAEDLAGSGLAGGVEARIRAALGHSTRAGGTSA